MEITTIMNLMLYDVGGVTVLGEGFAYALAKVSGKIFDAAADKMLPNKTHNMFEKLYTVIVETVEYTADERYKFSCPSSVAVTNIISAHSPPGTTS